MKPILFNTDMVRAILDGRKTVTRRIVKQKSKEACGFVVSKRVSDGAFMGVYDIDENEAMAENPQIPPYKVNDVLYVRETWRELIRPIGQPKEYAYKADTDKRALGLYKWKPSIHMPKEAARLFLRVTDVRVEKLRDMKLEDFLKEGILVNAENIKTILSVTSTADEQEKAKRAAYSEARDKFKDLWNSTAGKPHTPKRYANGWYGNPYVWVIDFEVITAEQAKGK